ADSSRYLATDLPQDRMSEVPAG
ncbi:MAG: hypothetical protein QOE03_2774, partial [Micromonosporaceae bacterium]|nr:hypothetical protein [Micromonosporaceae bacterium]